MPQLTNELLPDVSQVDDHALVTAGLELIQQGLSIFNADMQLISWNRRFLEMFELPGDFIRHGISFHDINYYLARRGEFGPGDPRALTEERVERARRFEPHYFERTRPNGRRISVEGNPLKQGGWIAIYSDITESHRQEQLLRARSDLLSDRLLHHSGKLAESNRELAAANRALTDTKAALQASEERMRVITQAMPAHIAYLDRNYVYRFTNNRFGDVMGLDREVLTGKNLTDVFPPNVFETVKPQLERAFSGQTVTTEYEIIGQNGTLHSIRTIFTPEISDDGTVEGVFVLSLNVSDEKAATELLVRSKRLETTAQLTSGLAHDFSNILTVILGNLSRLSKVDLGEGQRSDLVTAAERAARRGTRIIDNLMNFLFRQRLHAKETNVSRLLRELARLFAASIDERLTLDLQLPATDLDAYIDESAFQDAVLNILFNARDALESGTGTGTITLTLQPAGGSFEVSVADEGPGFSEEALKQAQEPFFTTKPQGKGSGLGLAMVQNFAEQSAGAVRIENRADGGAIVTLSIPVRTRRDEGAAVPAGAYTEAGEPLSFGRGRLVLIADDDPEMRVLMRDFAAEAGFSVIEAECAGEALQLLEKIPEIKAVVSDITMPGEILAADLDERLRGAVPLAFVTGLPAADPTVKALGGHHRILRKPFTRITFTRLLAQLVEDEKEPA
ncbi:hybrid sensor histidine kinase/response regulator [Oricola cellulosilytica]|uniref:histidine kinase n=1 Tax=Oricola cellulosilytica TaxID=1429082 RepID=A0A4V2MNW4_9HYPH|nr:PAS-domain containing protein [Oricola cellulosilytica]TCD14907.1 PAS domain S-box protein [Oricola cellulosilytica]